MSTCGVTSSIDGWTIILLTMGLSAPSNACTFDCTLPHGYCGSADVAFFQWNYADFLREVSGSVDLTEYISENIVYAVNLSNRGITSVAQGGLRSSCFQMPPAHGRISRHGRTKTVQGIPSPDIKSVLLAVILDNNNLTVVPELQGPLQDYDIVTAANNNIHTFPAPVFFSKCSHLILNHNAIADFGSTENPLQNATNVGNNLIVIDLNYNNLSAFGSYQNGFCPELSTPTSIATGALYITARHNPGITEFPVLCRVSSANASSRTIRNTFVDLAYNEITSLPDFAVYNHSGNFLYVDLQYNRITALGSGAFRFGKWPGALALYIVLEHNQIERFDAPGLFQSGNCVHPDAAGNQLAYVSVELSLTVSNNPITYVGPEVFAPVSCYTDASPNAAVLNDTCFAGMVIVLEQIAMKSWNFSWLQPFSGMKLDVQFGYNKIMQLPPGAFAGICAERLSLNATGNNLTKLPDRLFAGMSAHQLIIDFNQCSVEDVGRVFDGYVATCTNAQLPEFQASQWRLLPRSVSVNLSHNALRDTGIFAVVNSFTLNKTGIFELDASYNNVSQLRPFMIPTMKEPGSWGGHIVERTTGYSIGLAHNPIALIPNTTFAGHNMDFLEAISLDLSNREAIDGHALPPLEIEPLVFSNATIERGVWRSAPFNLSIDLTGTGYEMASLRNITANFPGSPGVLTVSLADNNISEIDAAVLDTSVSGVRLGAVWNLSLSGNQISKIPNMSTFVGSLDVSFNLLTALHSATFVGGKFASINASHNNIQTVACDAFGATTSLHTLDLSHNAITIISDILLAYAPSIRNFAIAFNPISILPESGLPIFTVIPGTILTCDVYFPRLLQCQCQSNHVYSTYCGHGRCLQANQCPCSNTSLCGNGSALAPGVFMNTSDCGNAPFATCGLAQTCAVGKMYQIQAPTITSDTQCSTITDCKTAFPSENPNIPVQAYEFWAPTSTSNRMCSICSTCAAGAHTTPCTATRNTVCTKKGVLSGATVFAITMSVGMACAVAVVLVMLTVRARRQQIRLRDAPHTFAGELERLGDDGILSSDFLSHDGSDRHKKYKPLELKRDILEIKKPLGNGNAAIVCAGQLLTKDRLGNIRTKDKVAIKCPKANREVDEAAYFDARQVLLEETAILAQLHHPNVVRLLGVVTRGQQALVIMELCVLGSLSSLLATMHRDLRKRKVDPDTRAPCAPMAGLGISLQSGLVIALQVARGMAYLTSRRVVHRDLAARNILVTSEMCFKIADFGMSRQLEVNRNYYTPRRDGLIPMRWTALELMGATTPHFNHATDVWAYGITIYEAFTWGALPYANIPNDYEGNREVYDLLCDGYRLPSPFSVEHVSDTDMQIKSFLYYKVIHCCWEEHPAKRPTFTELVERVERFADRGDISTVIQGQTLDITQNLRREKLGCMEVTTPLYTNARRTRRQRTRRKAVPPAVPSDA
eukprot:m.1481272 g.1481272  ORF g.1481272 m.1481272 type:complete len:1444 (-) comp25175_c0_seq1:3517-7848(-)